jgi:hypothetical protein
MATSAKWIISLGALALLVARLIWPDAKVDAVAIGLFIVAILPWLANILESAKLPGGWEIKFRNLQRAGQQVVSGTSAVSQTSQRAGSFSEGIATSDPNLALVAIRIEIERRLRAIAQQHEIPEERSLLRLFRRLHERKILTEASLKGLEELVMAGNQAAHGARVESHVAEWAAEYGPQILATLDAKLANNDKTL